MNARERILARLRANAAVPTEGLAPVTERDTEWWARQPPIDDLAARFTAEQEAVGGRVLRCKSWKALPEAVAPWVQEFGIRSAITGTGAVGKKLEPLREHLTESMGVAVDTYDAPLEEKRPALFGADCGITTAVGGIAETGSVILWPTPEEPRLLSLAVPVHIAIVESKALHPTLAAFLATEPFTNGPPGNLVLATGASRTADIEQTLTIGVHGPKTFLVVLIG